VDSIKARRREPEEHKASEAKPRQQVSDDAAYVSPSMATASDAKADPTRSARIAQLQNQIRSGTYKVSSAQIALALARDIG
jgi:anti-sigma28 factor (negative regulator of flagellin synthesis)